MKPNKLCKRITSLLLGAQIGLLQPLCSLADLPRQEPTVIDGTRLEKDQLTEGDLVYFGVSGLTLKEANDTYEVAIYREGNLDEEASVTLHALDISASYGEDYRLLGSHLTTTGEEETILQQVVKSSKDEDEAEGTEYSYDEESGTVEKVGKTSATEVKEKLEQAAAQEKNADDEDEKKSAEDAKKSESSDEKDAAETSEEKNETEDREDEEESSEEKSEEKTETSEEKLESEGAEYSEEASEEKNAAAEERENTEAENREDKAVSISDDAVEKAETSDQKDAAETVEKAEREDKKIENDDEKSEEKAAEKTEAAHENDEKSEEKVGDKTAEKTEVSHEDSEKTDASENSDVTEEQTDAKTETETAASTKSTKSRKPVVVDDLDTEEESNDDENERLASASVLSVAGSDAVTSTKSRLALLKEEATGEPTREEGSSGVSGSLTDAILAEIMPEQIAEIPYAAEQTITFAPNEDVQYVRFKVYDDDASEGTEAFSLMITDAENMEPYKVTSLSVILTDDEAAEQSEVSFASDSFAIQDGKAEITLERSGADYSMASVNIRGKSDESGEEKVYGTVVFAPYEMEKTVELELSGDTTLSFSDYLASKAGSCTEASTIETEGSGADSAIAVQSGDAGKAATNGSSEETSQSLHFEITISGKKYTVEYKKGDVVGTIYDKNYDPALEVGQYYFSTSTDKGGIYSYGLDQRNGSKPNGLGTLENNYVLGDNETDYAKGYGNLKYYHSTTWCVGSTWTSNAGAPAGRPKINSLYYQYLVPHWSQHSSFGYGNKVRFEVCYKELLTGSMGNLWIMHTDSKNRNGKFEEPELSDDAAIQVKNVSDNLETRIYAADDTKWLTPKNYARFYGVAAMYKKYRVSVENPKPMEFKGASKTVALQTKVECGAQVPTERNKRDIYANVNEDNSNIVFTINKNNVNGADGIFGTITGYQLTLPGSDQDKKVMVNYPDDYITYLRNQVENGASTAAIDFSSSAVDTVIQRVKEHLDTVTVDKYFTSWIERIQNTTVSDGVGYYQELNFKPTVTYNDVKVSAVSPDRNGGSQQAHFKAEELNAAGKSHTYHAGDRIDLSAVSEDPNFRVVGYEISEDGGVHFNSIRDNSSLTLRSEKNYVVRPLLAKNDNHIEVIFASEEAKRNLAIEDLMPEKELATTSFKGQNVINLHPEKTTVDEKTRPAVGNAYTLRVLVTGKPAEAGYIYRPVITDHMKNETYHTQGYSFIERSNTSDNVFTVDVEKVRASDLQNYSLTGTVVTRMQTIRETGVGAQATPVGGYTVSLANGEITMTDANGAKSNHVNMQFATSGQDGNVELTKLKALPGDRVTLLLDDGINDAQVEEYVFGETNYNAATKTFQGSAGLLEIQYPLTAPRITSISYDYDKADSRQNTDLRKNEIRCADDNLTLSAVVDTKGRSIEKLIYTVQTVTGSISKYEAKQASAEDPTLFVAKIPSMLTNLHSGDRITVAIVDKEKRTMQAGDRTQSIDIVYPAMDTGLKAYVENEIIAPKNLELSKDMDEVNIPILGESARSSIDSGTLGFSRVDWPNGTGYSLNINMDTMLRDDSPYPADKIEKFQKFKNAVKKTSDLKKEARAAGEDSADAGANVDQIRKMTENGGSLSDDEQMQLSEYSARKEASDKLKGKKESEAKDEMAAFTKSKDAKINISVMFNISLEFIYNPVRNEFVHATTSVTVGGAVDVSKTFYTLIGYVPCFINLYGGAEVDVTLGGVQENAQKAYSEGDFNKYGGNVANVLTGSNFLYEVNSVLKGRFTVGAGISGVLSARGYVSLQMKLQFIQDNVTADSYGVILSAAGGIGIDLVLVKMNVDVAKISKGWGNYAGKTKVSYFNNLIGRQYDDASSQAANSNDAVAFASDGSEGDQISFERYDMGSTDDFSRKFRSMDDEISLQSTPTLSSIQYLNTESADRTRPEMVELPDGRYFATFIAAKPEDANGDNSCLYYTIRENGEWSTPEPVDEDGTYDSMAALTVVGDQVVVAWMDATKQIEDENAALTMANYKEKYNAFGISGRVFDSQIDKWSDEFSISSAKDAEFYNLAPSLCTVDEKVYCTYMTRDLCPLTDLQEMADLQDGYSTMNRAVIDVSGYEPKVENAYVVIKTEDKNDPLVTDYQSEGLHIGNDEENAKLKASNYLISAYTVDQDAKAETEGRTLYLELYNMSEKKNYHPIPISSESPAVPKLTKANGKLFLSWTEHGTEFKLLDVSELVTALFHTDEIGTAYRNDESAYTVPKNKEWPPQHEENSTGTETVSVQSADTEDTSTDDELEMATKSTLKRKWKKNKEEKERTKTGGAAKNQKISTASTITKEGEADTTATTEVNAVTGATGTVAPNYHWYQKTAGELGLPLDSEDKGSDGKQHSYTYYDELCENRFRTAETKLKDEENASGSIEDYTITGDGQDLYIFYTDLVQDACEEEDEEHGATVELYARRYRRGKDSDEKTAIGSDTKDDKLDDISYESWGFTDAVQITNEKDVIDDFALIMDVEGNICMLSDSYNQWIDEDGKIQFDKNQMMSLYFKPENSLKIDQSSIDFDSRMVAGETSTLSFDIVNEGLMDAKGFTITAELYNSKNLTTTKLYTLESDRVLDTNESVAVQIPWTVPEGDLNGQTIVLYVKEKDTDGKEIKVDVPLSSEARLSFDTDELRLDGTEAVLPFTLSNAGNIASDACEVKAYTMENSEEKRLVGTVQVPAIGSGETKEAELRFTPELDDWNDFGTIEVELVAKDGDTAKCFTYADLYSIRPVMLVLEDGAETLDLATKEQKTLKVDIAPWAELVKDLEYRSTDDRVATVDASGNVTGVGKGTCTIEVFSPSLLLEGSITVNVSGSTTPTKRSSSRKTAADRASELYASGLPTWVETSGRWIQNADGSWSYQTGTAPMRNRWVCIYNPYADEKKRQKRYGWFKFDKDGKMLTGWVTDADGQTYYLNPASDGTRGMMLFGWQLIDGKWYYFSEAEGSGIMGALYRNTVTPDGYRVDQNGVWDGAAKQK